MILFSVSVHFFLNKVFLLTKVEFLNHNICLDAELTERFLLILLNNVDMK